MKKTFVYPEIEALEIAATHGDELTGDKVDQSYYNNTTGETWEKYFASGESGNYDLSHGE